MSISYSGIVNYGKVVLPSVESWGSNNNILRDPPRSITTRRVDKVTDTIMIDQEIQDSAGTNRSADYIRVYPRGANVMVGVSYDNFGTNGGNRTGQALLYNGQQSKLPYRVARDGAFRPPILTQQDLLPLSRLPRNNVKVDPIAYTTDFTKKLICPGTAKDYRSVKNETISVNTTAPVVQYIRKPTEIPVSQNIQDKLQVRGDTIKVQNIQKPVEISVYENIKPVLQGDEISSNKRIQNDVQRSRKYTDHTIKTQLNPEAYSNKRIQNDVQRSRKYTDHSIKTQLNPEAYSNKRIQNDVQRSRKYTNDSIKNNLLKYNTLTNKSQNIYKHVDSKVVFRPNAKVNTSADSNIKGVAVKYNLHETHELKKKPVLRAEVQANPSQRGVYSPNSQEPMSRNILLPKKGTVGFIEGTQMIPSMDRAWNQNKLKGVGFFDMMNKNKNILR